MTMARALRRLLAAALLAACGPALAHLMPAQQGTVTLNGDFAFVVVSLPVSALGGDDTGDGLLSLKELERNYLAMQKRVTQGVRMADGGEPAHLALVQLMPDEFIRAGAGAAHISTIVRFNFRQPPAHPRIEIDLFGRGADERQFALKAQHGAQAEAVVLTPLRPAHALFRPAWQALGDYVLLGAEHILVGLDHLLFLLTVLVVGAGWRYWLAVVTSFTLAHSLTLTLAALGWVSLPAAIAEPLIAASIIAVAWDNLRRSDVKLAPRSAIVFACGLVHGLGFARALDELGGAEALWLRLAGFNLGVELGQLAFVVAALGAMAAARRWVPALRASALVRATSWSAAGVGGLLLVQLLASR
jgi:hydrogenase/urease accessory protein HupE